MAAPPPGAPTHAKAAGITRKTAGARENGSPPDSLAARWISRGVSGRPAVSEAEAAGSAALLGWVIVCIVPCLRVPASQRRLRPTARDMLTAVTVASTRVQAPITSRPVAGRSPPYIVHSPSREIQDRKSAV